MMSGNLGPAYQVALGFSGDPKHGAFTQIWIQNRPKLTMPARSVID
jgi:hypothetical protein